MAESKISKPFLVIAGIGVLLIVAFLAFRVLGGDGGDDGGDGATPAATAAAGGEGSTATTTPTTTPAAPSTPNGSFDVFTTKNPFQPLVVASTATGAETGTGDTAATQVPVDETVTPTPAVPTEQAPTASTPVSLLEVYPEGATVKARMVVGATSYTVGVGETFATSYKVISLDAATGSGQFQYGDTTFELRAGEQTYK
jgi:hypothetical protein